MNGMIHGDDMTFAYGTGGGIGRCAVLGYPYRRLEPSLEASYREGAEIDEVDIEPGILEIADYIVRDSRREIYVLEDSRWRSLLAKHVHAGRLKICAREDIFRIALMRGNIVFLDNRELTGDIGKELLVYVGVYLPSIVTCRQLNVLARHFDYLKGMADAIDERGRTAAKKFIFLCNATYHDLVLGDVLYCMTDSIDAVFKSGFRRRFCEGGPGVLFDETELKGLNADRHALLVPNGDGFHVGLGGWFRSLRSLFLYNTDCECYFLHQHRRVLGADGPPVWQQKKVGRILHRADERVFQSEFQWFPASIRLRKG